MGNALRIIALSVGISAVSVAVLWASGQMKFDLAAFSSLIHVRPVGVVLVVLVLLLWWGLAGLRIKLLAGPNSPSLTLWRASSALLVSLFSAAVTPAAAGSSFGLVWYLSRYLGTKRATAMAVFGLVLDLVYFAWSLPVCFAILTLRHINLGIPFVGLLAGVASLLAMFLAWALAFRVQLLERLVMVVCRGAWLGRFQRGAIRFVRETATVLQEIRGLPLGTQMVLHVLTTLGFVAHFAAFNMVAFALGIDVDHVALVAAQSLIVAFSFVVPTPGGSGYFEAAVAAMLKGNGVNEAAIAPLTLIWRFVSYYLYVLIGPFIGGSALLRANQKNPQGPEQQP